MANSIATNDVGGGLLTYGITLWYSADGTDYSRVPDLQEIGDFGNGGDQEQIDVTTLVDPQFRYIAGLDAGSSGDGGIECTGLYSGKPGSGFEVVNSIAKKELTWQLRLPNGKTGTATGSCSEATLTNISVNNALQFTFSLTLGRITWGGTYDATLSARDDMNGERIDVAAAP